MPVFIFSVNATTIELTPSHTGLIAENVDITVRLMNQILQLTLCGPEMVRL